MTAPSVGRSGTNGTGTGSVGTVGERAASCAGVPAEATLVALWLLGRVPDEALPWPVLRPGRAGRGPGPDVREATVLLPSGVPRSGSVEVHVRASDFWRHGHDSDPAYAGLLLHLVWIDDRPGIEAAPGTPTVAVGPALRHDVARIERLLRLGPAGGEPCEGRGGSSAGVEAIRGEGRRRLAERARRTAELVSTVGWDEAWRTLLDRALVASAGRLHESEAERVARAAAIDESIGQPVLRRLCELASTGRPTSIIECLRASGTPASGTLTPGPMGRARAAEVGWNAVLPLLVAAAVAYDDVKLARSTATLASRWPAPRRYGRTRALQALLGAPPRGAGALHAQGLLRMQELWCERGGCGACPLSSESLGGPDVPGARAVSDRERSSEVIGEAVRAGPVRLGPVTGGAVRAESVRTGGARSAVPSVGDLASRLA